MHNLTIEYHDKSIVKYRVEEWELIDGCLTFQEENTFYFIPLSSIRNFTNTKG